MSITKEPCTMQEEFLRGIVYDVGLRFHPNVISVSKFDSESVAYDINIISNILRCNSIRIEGEEISRLVTATEIAHKYNLKVLFNPWKMGVDEGKTIEYMTEAAKSAELLRKKGVDIIFVMGCEYSLFSKGVFPGETFNDRLAWFSNSSIGDLDQLNERKKDMIERNKKLNQILQNICKQVKQEFHGPVTYSSGTWETVDWKCFDIVGVDYYRNGENEGEYLNGLLKYKTENKRVIVMEVGCCTFKGAAKLGAGGFSILKGVDKDGNPIYENNEIPVRDEKEQADYVDDQIRIIRKANVWGAFIFEFSFPINAFRLVGYDADLTSFAIVASFPPESPNYKLIPAWAPKEAFYRLGKIYRNIELESFKS